MTPIPLDKARSFLRETPPFSALPAEIQEAVAGKMLVEFFPRGEVFIRADEKPLDHLYLIEKGAVRLFTWEGRAETLIDLRCEGDSIGSISLVENAPPSFNAAAEQDTICYLVARDVFIDLIDRFPSFRIFSAHILRGLQHGPERGVLLDATEEFFGADPVMFTTPVRELVKRAPVCCPPGTRIRDAARIMRAERVGAMVVVDENRRALGIFTDRDLRSQVVAEGMSAEAPVESIMRTDVASVSADSQSFEALISMIKRNIHHVAVLDEEKLWGVVTQHDLLILQGNNPVSVVKDIDTAPGLDQLALVQHNLDRLVHVLIRQGLSVSHIQDVITLINDHLMQRLIEISIRELESQGQGTPPLPWAWVGSGSAGRKEQIMRTDHDCAITYADPPPGQEEDIRRYFLSLAEQIISGLERCGFPRCREQNMANNPKWCQSVSVWSDYFQTWLRESDPGTLKSAALFFDARFIFGDESVVHEVMRVVRRELLENKVFIARMAESALSERAPLGFFRQFVVETSGDHANRLNLKKKGLQPAVAAVRLLSLEQRLPETNTLERLHTLKDGGILDAALARDAMEAFSFMFMLRIKNYLRALSVDRYAFDWVNPELLPPVERRALKVAFKVVSRLQDNIASRYGI